MSTAVAPTNTANIDTLDAEPSSVSRHGRVRKKNSLLAEYDSLDSLDKPRKKYEKEKTPKKGPGTPKVTLKIGSDDTPRRPMKKGPKGKKMTLMTPTPVSNASFKSSIGRNYLDDDDDDEGELEIDLPPEFQSSMPMLGAEEIIDEGLLDEEDGATEIAENTSINRLKSQAESTYFMEKSLEKGRKVFPGLPGPPGKIKQTRKDKGSSRVTAYMLWSKEQRSIFDKKNMSADFPQMSKKLSDLWATVPPNQKKMWKNKAAKMMKKKANVNENMKNSAPGVKGPAQFGSTKKTPPGAPVKETNAKGLKKSSPHLVPVTAAPTTAAAAAPKITPKTTPKGAQSKSTTPAKAKLSLPATKGAGRGRPGGGGASTAPKSYFSPNSVDEKPSNVSVPKKGNRNFLNLNNGHSSKYSGAFQTKQQFSPRKDEDPLMYKVTGTAPLDVAAHFSLLGESLSIIGERLKEHEGQTVSGSLSVLLDSLLCACGPLLCLTQQVPELNVLPQERLNRILDSIAYIMPGL